PGPWGFMAPQLLLVAALAGCLRSARSCVICDRRVQAALDSLDKEYLPTHLAPERHREVMETITQTVRNFRDLPYLEDAFMGVIGEGRVVPGNPASWEMRNDTFVKEFSWMLSLEKAAFQSYVARFQRRGEGTGITVKSSFTLVESPETAGVRSGARRWGWRKWGGARG
uniref:Izumo sperm-egg fusion protein 1 n=1 Tax=Suricata suricatta TaxID=37032 RepID=A0A673VHP0_SURSU